MIDSVFHSRKATPITVDTTNTSVVINGAPPLPKEDPLVNYTPPTSTPVSSVKSAPVDPLGTINPIVLEPIIAVSQPIEISQTTNDSVPDWLKATSNIEKETPKIESTPIAHPIDSMSPLFEVNIAEPIAIDPTPTTVLSDDGIPGWIKNSPTTETTQILDPLVSHSDTETSYQSKPEVSPTSERLPDWLMNSIQSDTVPETDVVDTLPETPMMTETAETNIAVVKKSQKKSKKTQTIASETATATDASDIPNWLK